MEEHYMIWSYEHNAWWAPEARGYTRNHMAAGNFTRDQALWHLSNSLVGGAMDEIIVPENLAMKLGNPRYHPYHGASK